MFSEFIRGFGILIGYFIICASCAFGLRRLFPIPAEVFRKTLHMIVLGSIFVWTYAFETWWISAISAGVLAVAIYPLLVLAERLPGFSKLLSERKKGEIKRSMVSMFGTFVILICICWGLLGKMYLVNASVCAWGLGDAAAALVGKRFGRHGIMGRLVEGRKSFEGTFSMFVASFVSVLVVLLASSPLAWYYCIPISLLTAVVSAVVELYTKGGMDTITCPLAAAAVLIPLIFLLGV